MLRIVFPFRVAIAIRFCASEQRSCNFNLLCKIKGKSTPLKLNVKTEGYAIHICAWLESAEAGPDQEVPSLLDLCLAPTALKAAQNAARKVTICIFIATRRLALRL